MLHRLLALIFLSAGTAFAASPTAEEVQALLERSGREAIRLPASPGEGQAAAEELFRLYRSPEYQRTLAAERTRIETEVFGKAAPPPVETGPAKAAGRLAPDERIYVFVSASLPMETLRNYAADIAGSGEAKLVMVLRGFVGGARQIGPTARFTEQVLRHDPGCEPQGANSCAARSVPILVDPLLFRRYGIERVPAVVYARGVSVLDADQSEGRPENATAGTHFAVYGDAGLPYVLELIQREAKSAGLAALLSGPLRRVR
jgi:type-F conjugative transfer system pilin assembly protein TrbC